MEKMGNKIGIGIMFGTAIGVATDNLGLWIGIGIAIGAGLGTIFSKKSRSNNDDEN